MVKNSNGKYEVVLIEEGLGNFGSKFYYCREALKYAADNKVFEGKKAYADHPDKLEEQTRPERSVRDIFGHYENVRLVEGPSGQAILMADLSTLSGDTYNWARTLIDAALDYSGKFDSELVGLSINAGGESVKKPLDDLLQSENLPKSVIPKLLKAQAEGITDVEYCTALMEAVSVDLVTEAGARGRFIKMIESEKTRMSKKIKQSDEKKIPEEIKKEGDEAPTATHDDAAQDKELISSMLKKYVGDEDHSEEVQEAMKQAYASAKEMGLEGEEAEKAAGYCMKMAKHTASKQAAKEADEAKKEADLAEASKQADEAKKESDESKKLESDVIKLNATVAGLTKKLKERDVAEFLESTIRKAGFEGNVAKKFKESIGSVKSEEEITEKFNIFKEALTLASSGHVFLNPEKTSGSDDFSISFADCVKE